MIEPTTLARPYARAVFEFARAAGDLESWQSSLATLAAVIGDENVGAMLKDPGRTGAERASTLLSLLGDEPPEPLANFVSVMADNDRLALMPDVLKLFMAFKADVESTVTVDVASAYELSTDEVQRLGDALGKRLQRNVEITTQTDPTLLGGALIRAGDLVIDGSVRGRLEKLAGALTP